MEKYILTILTLILLAGCQMQTELTPKIGSITLETDKDLYHSNEIIHVTSKVSSQTDLNNITIHFYGIYAGRYRLEHTLQSELKRGENIIIFDYTAPKCYGCAGISPGTYQISADVLYDSKIMSTTTINVELRQ